MHRRTASFDYAAALSAVAEGRHDALRRLYDHDAPRLLGIALRIVRRREVAEDVVHEVFVRLWNNPQFDPTRGNGRAWLGTLVRNRAIEVARREGRLSALDDKTLAAMPDTARDPAEALELMQDADALRECLQRLDRDRLACITLAYVEGLSQSEIAVRQNMPLGTVKTWIRRSLIALRECLE